MTRFTKEMRRQIVQEFAVRHNGLFDAGLFVREVRETGESHAAWDWFEWDKNAAFDRYQLEQAREFARDLRVAFRVEEVSAPHRIRIHEALMPFVISPLATRQKGGGYVLVDPDDPEHIREHRQQAAKALSQWLDRYAAALVDAKIKPKDIKKLIRRLESGASTRNTVGDIGSVQASA